MDHEATLATVKEYYGKVLASTASLQTTACTPASAPTAQMRQLLVRVPERVRARFYGCGTAVPLGIEGLAVLDLGSGSGQDCYVAAQLVGPRGRVTGVDMTPEQLEVARACVEEFGATLGWKPALSFVEALIERLPTESDSVDLVISNCVVNLSPRKDLVLREAYRVLRNGGEMYFSDVYCDRRLPESVRQHRVLWGECIAGALYLQDFLRLCHAVGFADPREVFSWLFVR
jgi:SAM-dependent methyltransferase